MASNVLCSQLTNRGKITSFLVGTAEVLVLLPGLSHMPIPEAVTVAEGWNVLSRPESCTHPWSSVVKPAQLELHELKGHQGQGFPKENWMADTRMRKNGF